MVPKVDITKQQLGLEFSTWSYAQTPQTLPPPLTWVRCIISW